MVTQITLGSGAVARQSVSCPRFKLPPVQLHGAQLQVGTSILRADFKVNWYLPIENAARLAATNGAKSCRLRKLSARAADRLTRLTLRSRLCSTFSRS